MAYGPFQGAVENPAGARPSKCIIILSSIWREKPERATIVEIGYLEPKESGRILPNQLNI
jgi:hypothetical protein